MFGDWAEHAQSFENYEFLKQGRQKENFIIRISVTQQTVWRKTVPYLSGTFPST